MRKIASFIALLLIATCCFAQSKLSPSFIEKTKDAIAAIDSVRPYADEAIWRESFSVAERAAARLRVEAVNDVERDAARKVTRYLSVEETCHMRVQSGDRNCEDFAPYRASAFEVIKSGNRYRQK